MNTSSGTPLFTHKRISLLKLGSGYITEPVSLRLGSYTIQDFLITLDSKILFATPKSGSPLSAHVTRPLPSTFIVKANKVSEIEMQVISTDAKNPQAFGYATFAVEVVNPLLISVFLKSDDGFRLFDAKAELYDGDMLVESFSLKPVVNAVAFRGDPDKSYTLVVHKDGYGSSEQTFTYSALVAEAGDKPLEFILEPTLEIVIESYSDQDNFELSFTGQGKIDINGDGDFSGSFELPKTFSDMYVSPGTYNLEVNGDIKSITGLTAFGYGTGIRKFRGLEHLASLEVIMTGLYFYDRLDLRHNKKLRKIEAITHFPNDIMLPEDHFIKGFTLVSGKNLTSAKTDELVFNLYRNAEQKGIYFGSLEIPTPDGLSAAALEKLRLLRYEFQWQVYVADMEIFE
jgi:hypothetical protein